MAKRMVFTFTCPINETAPDEGLDGVFPSGERLLGVLASYLSRHGVDVGEVRPYKFYGWVLRISLARRAFDLYLQYSKDYALSYEQVGLFNCLRATRSCHECVNELGRLVADWIATECGGTVIAREEENASPLY
jgi:hypothetical protein